LENQIERSQTNTRAWCLRPLRSRIGLKIRGATLITQLGAALLISGDAAGAETSFREGLRRTPNNGRMLFGLRESLRAQNKVDEMAWVEREFQRAWKNADLQLRLEDL